jgi:hypothetical protein
MSTEKKTETETETPAPAPAPLTERETQMLKFARTTVPIITHAVGNIHPKHIRGWPHAKLIEYADGLSALPGADQNDFALSAELVAFARECKYWEDARKDRSQPDTWTKTWDRVTKDVRAMKADGFLISEASKTLVAADIEYRKLGGADRVQLLEHEYPDFLEIRTLAKNMAPEIDFYRSLLESLMLCRQFLDGPDGAALQKTYNESLAMTVRTRDTIRARGAAKIAEIKAEEAKAAAEVATAATAAAAEATKIAAAAATAAGATTPEPPA